MGLLREAHARLNASAGAVVSDDSPAVASEPGGRLGRLLSARPVIGLYLMLLVLYVVSGVPVVAFHGDEAMQIYMSSDYATAILEGAPGQLLSYPPFSIDSDQHLRLINGTVNRYLIGLSWHMGGFTRESLPPRPGWDWGLSYDDNVATGHRSPPELLSLARLSSALLTGAAAVLVFAIGRRTGGLYAAYLASFLFAFHPVILVNGRRAMQEGSMLFFGLLTIFAAVLIISAVRQHRDGWRGVLRWLLLVSAGTLTLASKHSGVIFLAAAYLWIGLDTLWGWLRVRDQGTRTALKRIGGLGVSGVVTLLLWVLVSPALWSAPLDRFGDLLAARTELLNIQVAVDPVAPLTFEQRLIELARQPFVAAAQHFEVASWGETPAIRDEIAAYQASPLSGLAHGPIAGAGLTLLAGVGLSAALRNRAMAGLALWCGVVAVSLLANPLPWQRYYLPLIPPTVLLAGIGMRYSYAVVRRALRKEDV